FDLIYSYGVIGYTQNPGHCFQAICELLKPDGLIGIWILPEMKGPMGMVFRWIRTACRRLGPNGTRVLADLIVPFLYLVPTDSRIHLGNSSWAQCRETVLVDIAPGTLVLPSLATVRTWFQEC